MSGSSLSNSKNSSSSEKGSSSYIDSKNEEEQEEKKKEQRGSPCSNNGGLKAAQKLSAANYKEILLKNQARVEEDEKSDKKKKKLIEGLKVDLSQGVRGKLGDDSSRSMEIEHNGGHCTENKLKGVGDGRKTLEMDVSLEQLEIKAEDTVPREPQEVCGGVSCKDVQTKASAQMASDDNVCVTCKLGGSTGKLLGCNGKGCKKNCHLKCVDQPLKDVPPGDWHCFSCLKKNIESDVLLLLGAVESHLDTVELELADSENLDTANNSLCGKKDSNDNKLKEKPVRVVTSDSKFVEYWQYCDILLSNSVLLRSCSRNETVEALRDVVISTRKDKMDSYVGYVFAVLRHPYFVNSSLQKMLTKGLPEDEFMNVGIKASGKLKSNIGSSGICLGDVLDDVVRQRCGVDSYERVDCGLMIMPNSQFSRAKQAALTRFNDKDKGRIVFLLDRRACHPSIKLSSVDIVILYDSYLNPYNDLKVLQKITIGSQQGQLKLFRLYSFCTLEEMVLVHGKQNVTVDAQNLSHSTIHQMLRWGASYLFKSLSEFHGSCPSSGPVFSSEHSVKELLGPLPEDAGSRSTNQTSIVVRVNQTGGTYSRDISLPGELEMQSADKDPSHVFWTKLLNRKTPRWRYLDGYTQFSAQSIAFHPEVHLLRFPLETMHQTFNKLFKSSNHNNATGSSNYFTCEICTEPIPLNQKFKNMEASGCFHPYCTDCVAKYIEIKVVHNNLSDIKCPNTNCFVLLDALSCRSVLPRKVFDKWCRLLCETAVLLDAWKGGFVHGRCFCPNRKCSELILNECVETKSMVKRSDCPNCKQVFCFSCMVPWKKIINAIVK
ncbi:hypothetical protein MKX03_020521 [Papaver bracteatum]|nr:hypothetical protein MKX03_020521 [Papaver bracteatum]